MSSPPPPPPQPFHPGANAAFGIHHHHHHHHHHHPHQPTAAAHSHAHPHPHHHQPHRRHGTLPPSSSSAGAAGAVSLPHPLPHPLPSPTNPAHLPTPTQQAQVAQARTALVASLGNALDTELQTRAELLHANQAAIDRQERDVERALEDLRKEDERLLKVLKDGSRQVKELGDVQNWAERLERDFLVLEDTMRMVGEQGEDGGGDRRSGSWSGSQSGSWSGSESESGSILGDADGDVRMDDGHEEAEAVEHPRPLGKGPGKQVAMSDPRAMDLDPAPVALPQDGAREVATSGTVNETQALEQNTTLPQPSPGATSWFKKFIWRS